MAAECGSDPLLCIEFAVLAIGEFLKDWTTVAMLAVVLGLLLRLRADKQKARDDAYAEQLGAYEDRRRHERRQANPGFTTGEARRHARRSRETQARTWAVEKHKTVER
ncbi:MAG: hypothetical protein Q8O52_26580 [Sulfuritalea sp.]|nr:hypothetical protein [Sulfuritalea sp.]